MPETVESCRRLARSWLQSGPEVLKDQWPVFLPIAEFMLKNEATPASSSKSNHGGFEGGLLVHSHRLYQILIALAEGAYGRMMPWVADDAPVVQDPQVLETELVHIAKSSCFKVAMIHDLNKVVTLNDEPYYMPNMIKNGTQRSESKPWEVNKNKPVVAKLAQMAKSFESLRPPGIGNTRWLEVFDEDLGCSVRDGVVSLALAAKINPDVLDHLTPQEKNAIIFHDGAYAGRSGLTNNESLLQILLHAADMIAARFVC